jgi:hypothetical protein
MQPDPVRLPPPSHGSSTNAVVFTTQPLDRIDAAADAEGKHHRPKALDALCPVVIDSVATLDVAPWAHRTSRRVVGRAKTPTGATRTASRGAVGIGRPRRSICAVEEQMAAINTARPRTRSKSVPGQ